MNGNTVERQKLLEEVNTLPNEVLVELSNFLAYLRYKTIQQKSPEITAPNFLQSIAGLGSSQQHDISEQDEEILRSEIES